MWNQKTVGVRQVWPSRCPPAPTPLPPCQVVYHLHRFYQGVWDTTTATATKASFKEWVWVLSISIVITPTQMRNLLQMQANSFWAELRTIFKFRKSKKFSRRLFTSSIKRENRHFPVVVVQWWQRIVQKSVLYLQSCCFVYSNYCFFDVLIVIAGRCGILKSLPSEGLAHYVQYPYQENQRFLNQWRQSMQACGYWAYEVKNELSGS